MSSDPAALPASLPLKLDYSLTGVNAARAIERGLAEADWYQCPVPRTIMRCLLERRNGPAVRDTLLWFGLIFASGYCTWWLWPSWWAAWPYAIYAILYASTSDSRWHESGHGTAFKSDWMNNLLYEVASFMVMREPDVWRWSHTRHHSDTIIVGRDPEIVVPRPPDLWALAASFFNLPAYPKYFGHLLRHAFGQMSAEEKTFIPAGEFPKVCRKARGHLLVYAAVVGFCFHRGSMLPLFFVGFANLFGSWLMVIYGLTQHAGLAENVLDHRLNCRTVYMNPLNRYLYWNMNYHVEHHMFPLVPYHALPKLHALVKDDCPVPYPSLVAAYREIVPALFRQSRDPAYHVKRRLPAASRPAPAAVRGSEVPPDTQGWIDVGPATDLGAAEVIRFDHGRCTYALCRDEHGALFATDGICTHGHAHLAEGLVIGGMIECPKHNGRFVLSDGSPARAPVCRGLATYPLEERNGRLHLNVARAAKARSREPKACRLRVVSNRNVATFIKELVLESAEGTEGIPFIPGDYLQFDIPAYERIRFRDFDIPEPYAAVWARQHLFELTVGHAEAGRRNNYSIASNRQLERTLRFNVRIATAPPGQDCPPGVGSSYIFNLKAGDTVTATGPFGDFHPKATQREMVYIGGGAGMAPLRAHLSHLLETEQSPRKISFWYGARSRQELFYEDYFQALAGRHANFTFNLALSAPLHGDEWAGHIGFIHEVVREKYLALHANPKAVEYYLCGPPLMIRACMRLLAEFGVPPSQIACDEF